jgi:hypothetical protein
MRGLDYPNVSANRIVRPFRKTRIFRFSCWMAVSSLRLSGSFCVRLSSTSFPKSLQRSGIHIEACSCCEMVPDKTREARLSGMTP